MRASLLLLLCAAALGCGRPPATAAKAAKPTPSKPTPSKPTGTAAKPAAKPAKSGESAKPASPRAAAKAEGALYAQRRRIRPAVIGGCDEACETPQKAAGQLFDALASAKPVDGARRLFDWSILEVDGAAKGERWADLWGDVRKRGERDKEIATWLEGWLARFSKVKPEALLSSRASGVQFRPLPGRSDVVEMRWRHPGAGGEREWRVLWTLRGYEWLVSRIDHRPSQRPLGKPPLGSVKRGHL